ncbi:MAG TPA: M56 family metallopeptidase [Verrucomicrobiae bacterium]|nr:M56 family metallopeptidase [Verrucomicrobiae bacterium]
MMNAILLDGLWEGAIIAAIAAGATALLPQRHAATRYAVWFAALVALALVPVATVWHPAPAFAPLPIPIAYTTGATILVADKAASATGVWLLAVWLIGTACGFCRLLLSYASIARIVRNAVPAPELGAGVVTSDDLAIPIAAGLFKPVIVIPSGLASALERSDLESIVQHERAHIRRMDVAGNLVARLVEACLFFNPWIYVIGRQLIVEREAACDDWAVHAAGEPVRYATCLARLGQSARSSRLPLLTPSAIGSRHMLVGRIARLLNGKVAQLKTNYLVLGASVVTFAVLAVLLQTSDGRAATAQQTTVASASCNADARVLKPAMPNIPDAAYKPNVFANAEVTVAADGQPMTAKIIKSSGSAGIDEATVAAAMASTYSPKMVNCKAVVGEYVFHVQTTR